MQGSKTGAHHPTIKERTHRGEQDVGFCFMQGHHVGDALRETWNTRAAAGCHYVVQDGMPVFNDEGRGLSVSVQFLNDCFDYFRGRS